MNVVCIADEDTVRGFRLAGVAGQVVSTATEAAAALAKAAANTDLGLIIITDAIGADIPEQVNTIRLEHDRPLIVEIPGPHGPLPGRKNLRQIVQEAIGIRVGIGGIL